MPKKPATPPDTNEKTAAGVTPKAPPHAKTTKKGKLPKKHKRRLPRRQKKAQQRAQAPNQS